MKKQELTQNWSLQKSGESEGFTANIPTSVYSVLYDNGKIENPYFKANEDMVRDVIDCDFNYTLNFDADEEILKFGVILLRLEGVDTFSDVYLNETHLGNTYNMHRVWEFEVTDILKPFQNTLVITLHSPLKAAAKAFAICPTKGNVDTWDGFGHIRKAHYMYGWDWGPHLPDAGLFRPVSLVGINCAVLDSVYITQKHTSNKVFLEFEPSFLKADAWQTPCTLNELDNCTCEISVTHPDGHCLGIGDIKQEFSIDSPLLWWPNGLGNQPLYTVKATLLKNGQVLDTWSRRIGLRTMEMNTEKDEWGEAFCHKINGINFFAMGADYIPEENLLGHIDLVKRKQLLYDCKLANFNVMRVWGGGYYPDDDFFDICDELGFVVWHDLMFACSMYELTEEFEANITQEIIQNVKRIRHHACLGLWCGNNEMEHFTKEGEWITKPSEVRDYLFMYERIFPEIIKKYDSQSFYWPSSPSCGGSFDEPQSPDRGDVHYWEVWHGNKPFSEYRKFGFRYLSEFGFQSLPSFKTVQEGISDDARDYNLFSYVMEKHQRNDAANGKIMGYLQQTYKYPYDFQTMIYASQLLQADAIRYGVEHFRRNRGRCMGAIYWQLNDCWPVISWASIDYYGRWKALHYYAKRFFAPVMLSCEEQGWMSAEANMNRQHFEFEKSIRLNVTNETLTEKCVLVKWALRNSDASILQEGGEEITVAPLSAIWLDKICFPNADLFENYVSYELFEGEDILSSGSVIFSLPKYFKYQNPNLQVAVDGDEIVVSASAYAKSVEILNLNEDLVLSDNYFDMNAGTRRIKILRGMPEGLNVKSVYDIGIIK